MPLTQARRARTNLAVVLASFCGLVWPGLRPEPARADAPALNRAPAPFSPEGGVSLELTPDGRIGETGRGREIELRKNRRPAGAG